MRERLGGTCWPAEVSPPQGGKWLGEEIIGMGNLGDKMFSLEWETSGRKGKHHWNGKSWLGWEIAGTGNHRDGKLLLGMVVLGMVVMGTLAAHSTGRRFLVK